jgi:hypothetical protein
MRRPTPESIEGAGQDSFVDVVTNLVGIMIVLVLIVGVRVKHVWVEVSPGGKTPPPVDSSPADPKASLSGLRATAAGIDGDVRRVAGQIQAVGREIALRSVERERMATLVVAGERELADRRGRLESDSREDFDLRQQAGALQRELDETRQDLIRVENDRPPPVELKHFLTPLSRTVFGKEVHFRLSDGRLAYIPLEELFDRAKSEVRREGSSLSELTDHEHSVGPLRGFELQYTLSMESAGEPGRVAVRSKEWRIVPAAGVIGEKISDAMQSGSDFRSRLALLDPKQTTVTIWIYPESFADFSTIKDELHRLDFSAAARPLPPGGEIAGSEKGTRSAAQ